MQSSLWKLGALLGVIGVGFLVLLKAQNEMTDRQPAGESFSELAAIEELGELDAARTDQPDDESPTAESYSEAPSRPIGVAAENTPEPEPTPAIDPSVEPTPATDVAAIGSDSEAEAVNPFADFAGASAPAEQAEPTPAGWEGAPDAETAAAAVPTASDDEVTTESESQVTAEDPNPFGPLVESFSPSSAKDEHPQPSTADTTTPILPVLDSTASQQEPTEDVAAADMQAVELTPADAGDAFNTFPSGDTPDEPTTGPQSDASAAVASETEAAPPGTPFEPTSLTALPPADGGPALMAPPDDPAESDLPSQLEPAAFETDAGGAESATQIAQLSGEQPAGGESDPNPSLVFPGADEPSPSQAPQQQPQSPTDTPTAEPQFPDGRSASTGRAWVGDTPRIEVPSDVERMPQIQPEPQIHPGSQIEPAPRADALRSPDVDGSTPSARSGSDGREVLPDGTVEMTIMPRNGEPQTARVRQEPHAEVNPFAGGPAPESPRPIASNDARRLDAPPAREAVAAEPQFPDPGLSFSKGPIQPSAAEIPDTSSSSAMSGNGLTSADYIGVGTITPDTPSTPQQAQLTIEKQAPADASLGQDLIYSIHVKNVGRAEARNVVVEDLVPKGTELQGTDPQAHMTPDKKLVWKLGAMSPGASRTIRIKVIPREAGQIGSVATVSFEAAVASRTVITAPQLRLELNGPQEVRVGEKAPYTFSLTNSGSADASNVYIRNIIPAGFEHPAAQQRNGVTDIEYEVGTLRRGESREVELTLLAVAEGDFQNHAILSADGNVNVEAHQGVRVITSRLKVHREGPANRVVGGQAQFTNTVTNESGRPLQGVTITETIPVGAKFVQASDGGYFDPQQRKVIWQIDTLEPDGTRQLQTVVLAEQAGALESTVNAIDQLGDQAETSSTLNVAGYSSLTVDVANPARAIPVGAEVALRLKVRNGGTAAANGVETRVKLPPELKFVSARGPVRYAQQGEWIAFEPIERIDIQGEQTFDIVLTAAVESQDARVVVQLSSSELSRPLSEDESVVIYAE